VNQVAKGDTHEIRRNPAIRLDIHQVGIAPPVWIFLEPETKQEKLSNLETFPEVHVY